VQAEEADAVAVGRGRSKSPDLSIWEGVLPPRTAERMVLATPPPRAAWHVGVVVPPLEVA